MPEDTPGTGETSDDDRSLQQQLAAIGGLLDAYEGVRLDPDDYQDLQDLASERWDARDYEPLSPNRLFDVYAIAYPNAEDWITAATAVVSVYDTAVETKLLPVPTPFVAHAITQLGNELGSDPRAVVDPDAPYAHRVRPSQSANDNAFSDLLGERD